MRVQWRTLRLRRSEWGAVFALKDGLHPLASNATSGALDYYRDPRLRSLVDPAPPWKTGTDQQALTDLAAMLLDTSLVVIFGAAYPAHNGRPPGMHDIHQNQGDPPGPFAHLDAIWQDGFTIVVHANGTASAFQNRFSTQSDHNDEHGHSLPQRSSRLFGSEQVELFHAVELPMRLTSSCCEAFHARCVTQMNSNALRRRAASSTTTWPTASQRVASASRNNRWSMAGCQGLQNSNHARSSR